MENEEQVVKLYEASDNVITVNLLKKIKPDMIFLGTTISVKNGFEALEKVVSFTKNTKIIKWKIKLKE
ncbi:MAG: hypothetical protein ABDH59_04955 [Fervidobacterium sp.]